MSPLNCRSGIEAGHEESLCKRRSPPDHVFGLSNPLKLLIYPGAQCLCYRIRPFHCRQMTAVLHNVEFRSGDSVRNCLGY